MYMWHRRPACDSTGETPVPQVSLQGAKILGVGGMKGVDDGGYAPGPPRQGPPADGPGVNATMGTLGWISSLFDRSFDPATARRLPQLDAASQSNVRGLYMVGEIAGTPLIKLGLNAGSDLIDQLAVELKEAKRDPTVDKATADGPKGSVHDVLIVGAGSSGLGAAELGKPRYDRFSGVMVERRRVRVEPC